MVLSPSFLAQLLAVGMTLSLTACVTPARKTEPAPVKPAATEAKVGSKTDVAPEPAKPEPLPPPSTAEQLDFVKRQSEPDAEFGERDHEFTGRLPAGAEAGSVTEAALVLGVVGSAAQPLGLGAPTFEESDIADGGESHAIGNGMALEKIAKDKGVNLVDALSENPWLKSYGVARRVYQATKVTSDTEDYKREIHAALGREAARWNELANEIGGLGGAAGVVATPTETAPQDLPPPNPADLRSGDAVLAEAQALADRGNYQAAIKKAGGVVPTSPMYATAQEKIRDFSNLAVQDLRRKAAQAFQSAMPVTDVKVRSQYLQQAKQYLEQAIREFPQATQLPTVRDNLRVISRDLEKLQSEPGPG
jgi:hypothetical protein